MVAKKEVTFVIRARDLTRRAFRRIRGAIGSLRGQIVGLVAAFASLEGVRRVGQLAQDVENFAAQARLSTTEFQAFAQAFRRFGLDLDDVADVFFSINQAQSEALNFDPRQLEAFRRLGIDAQTLRTARPDELLLKMAEASAALNPQMVQEFFSAILGEDNARRLIPALQGGAEGVVQRVQQALEDRVASEQNIARAADANAAVQDTAQALLVSGINAGVQALDLMDDATNRATESLTALEQTTNQLVESNRQLSELLQTRLGIERAAQERSGAPLLEGDASYG